ncbi:MAG: DUF4399 domain-containing protein [Dehalococcoidia bacterium]
MRPSYRILALSAATLVLGFGAAALVRSHSVQAQAGVTVAIQAPANGATVSNPVAMKITSSGITIKAATAQDPTAAHYHYFIDHDPALVVKQGQQIPTGQPDIVHSADPNQVLPNLAAGPHTVWVVMAHTDHTPLTPDVTAKVSFSVAGGAAATPAPGAARAATPAAPNGLPNNGDDFTMLKLIVVGLGALLLAGGYTAIRIGSSRR